MTEIAAVEPLNFAVIAVVAAGAVIVVVCLVWGLRRWWSRFLPDLRFRSGR